MVYRCDSDESKSNQNHFGKLLNLKNNNPKKGGTIMKKVKAVMILSNGIFGEKKLFNELEHYLTIHDDGTVTESHYINTVNDTVRYFDPERVWDEDFLHPYEIEEF